PELTSYLAQFLQPGLKLAVTAPSGRVLARADALGQVTGLGPGTPILARLYRRFVDRPGARQLLESSAPIYDRDHTGVIGKLEVTQTANRWIRLRDHALMRMLNFSLSTSVVAVTLMFAFAAWLALRLSRLNECPSYLRTLAGKLAHEIRTPLTIVRSSLDNLESEQVPPSARVYLERARQGSERLNAILV